VRRTQVENRRRSRLHAHSVAGQGIMRVAQAPFMGGTEVLARCRPLCRTAAFWIACNGAAGVDGSRKPVSVWFRAMSDSAHAGPAVRSEDSARSPRGTGRPQRLLAVATVAGLLLATAAAFVITERLKLTPSPIAGTRVSKTFSPVCDCATDNATVDFRLRRGGLVQVDVITPGGTMVRRLARRRFRRGWLSFRWFGHDQSGRPSPDGTYQIRVHISSEHRTIVFPNTIRLDTVAPTIEQFSISRRTIRIGERTRAVYRFGDKAHPIVLVDGKPAVYGRFAHTSGSLDWFGRVGGLPVRAGIHRLALEARDDAGNTSAATGSIRVRVEAPVKRRVHGRSAKRRPRHG